MKMEAAVVATERFLACLVDADWTGATEQCQISWRQEAGVGAARTIEQVYKYLGITAFSIEGSPIKASAVMVDVPVALQTETRGVVDCLARVICEKGPYQPSRRGTWGVNPKSLLLRRTANATEG